jgi:hypothetical protein
VFQIAGVPPKTGRIIFANIGSRVNIKAELTKSVTAKIASGKPNPPGIAVGIVGYP